MTYEIDSPEAHNNAHNNAAYIDLLVRVCVIAYERGDKASATWFAIKAAEAFERAKARSHIVHGDER